jgi:hypothetical protein
VTLGLDLVIGVDNKQTHRMYCVVAEDEPAQSSHLMVTATTAFMGKDMLDDRDEDQIVGRLQITAPEVYRDLLHPEAPVAYAMLLQVDLHPEISTEHLQQMLCEFIQRLGSKPEVACKTSQET